MEARLCIEGLPGDITCTELRRLCGMYGRVVSAHVVKDMRGRSSSFGYVELSNSDEVDDLIHALDGADFLGSILYVSRTAHRVFQRQ